LEFNVPFQHKYGYIRDDTAAADSLAISRDLYDVSKDSVELSMSEALEHKLNPAVDTADIFTGVLQLCNHLPHLQPRND